MAWLDPGTDAQFAYVWFKTLILILVLPFSVINEIFHYLVDHIFHRPLRWEWDNAANPGRRKIDTWSGLGFPKDFLWGTATAAHQIEGYCTNNNWHKWEQTMDKETGKSKIVHGHKSGRAADHWNRVREDVNLMTDLGCNSYRLSVEWSKIEPKEGQFDKNVMKHYSDEIDLLLSKGITPMVTLHHFTQPLWFDELGGWEQEENIEYFIRFSEKVYQEFADKVPFWCTINEPTVFALVGWLQGSFPPGKRPGMLWNQIDDAVNVLKNLMIAHVRVYKVLKAIDNRPEIGLVQNIFQTRPYRRWHPVDYVAAYIADDLQNNLVIQFLRTGVYKFKFPILGRNFDLNMPEAKKSFDFIGLNYYSHMFYRFHFSLSDPIRAEAHPEDAYAGVMTDMDYPMYAEGLYLALHRLSQALPNVPIYVTENGVADMDDSRQLLFVKRYLYALSRAIKDGVNVKGYYYWTLMDNFEWAFGYTMRFGLYAVDYGKNGDGVGATLDRSIRPGGLYYKSIVERFGKKNK